jgi:hypothetical protein
LKNKKGVILSVFEESPPVTRHYPALQKTTKLAEGDIALLPVGVGMTHDDMIQDLDFEQWGDLPSVHEKPDHDQSRGRQVEYDVQPEIWEQPGDLVRMPIHTDHGGDGEW